MSDAYPTNPEIGQAANGRIWNGTRWDCPVLLIDAPADGNLYGRMNNTWQRALPYNGGELLDLIIDYDLDVMGNATIGGTLSVTGVTTLNTATLGDTTVAGTLDCEGPMMCNDMVASYGSFAGGQQPRMMVIGTDPPGISFGFWQNNANMMFGFGDGSGNIGSGAGVGGVMQLTQAGELEVPSISVIGDAYIGGNVTVEGTITEGSDVRLKSNIAENNLGLDVIRALKPKHYRRKGSGVTELGLIAQEVREVCPLAVRENRDLLGIHSMALISIIINGIKELADRVGQLEAPKHRGHHAQQDHARSSTHGNTGPTG
jgi:hypothetical protein